MPRRRGEAGILAALDRWQRRHAAAAFAVAVVRKFVDDRAPGLAALIAYYAFFSVFPLLLVFVSVLGFLLEDDPSLKADVVDSALARIPVVGAQLDDEVEPLTGSGVALGVGVAGALWAGLGVTLALGRAFDAIWDVPRVEQRGPLRSRAFGLVVLVVLGAALVASTAASGAAVGGAIGPAAERLGALSVALVANAIVFLAAFGLLTARPVRTRELLPGVALAAAGALALQAAGAWFVDNTVTRASDTYGAFALVIGLLSWFLLLAQLLLLAAEVNVVLRRRLWPRALTGELAGADRRSGAPPRPPAETSDRRSSSASATRGQAHRRFRWTHPCPVRPAPETMTATRLQQRSARHGLRGGLPLPEHPLDDDHLLRLGGLDLDDDRHPERRLPPSRPVRLGQGCMDGLLDRAAFPGRADLPHLAARRNGRAQRQAGTGRAGRVRRLREVRRDKRRRSRR